MINTNPIAPLPTPTHRLKRSDKRLWAEIRDWTGYLNAVPDRTELEETLLLGLKLVRATVLNQASLSPDIICEFARKTGFGHKTEVGARAKHAELITLTGKMLLAADHEQHTVVPRLACEFAAKFGSKNPTKQFVREIASQKAGISQGAENGACSYRVFSDVT